MPGQLHAATTDTETVNVTSAPSAADVRSPESERRMMDDGERKTRTWEADGRAGLRELLEVLEEELQNTETLIDLYRQKESKLHELRVEILASLGLRHEHVAQPAEGGRGNSREYRRVSVDPASLSYAADPSYTSSRRRKGSASLMDRSAVFSPPRSVSLPVPGISREGESRQTITALTPFSLLSPGQGGGQEIVHGVILGSDRGHIWFLDSRGRIIGEFRGQGPGYIRALAVQQGGSGGSIGAEALLLAATDQGTILALGIVPYLQRRDPQGPLSLSLRATLVNAWKKDHENENLLALEPKERETLEGKNREEHGSMDAETHPSERCEARSHLGSPLVENSEPSIEEMFVVHYKHTSLLTTLSGSTVRLYSLPSGSLIGSVELYPNGGSGRENTAKDHEAAEQGGKEMALLTVRWPHAAFALGREVGIRVLSAFNSAGRRTCTSLDSSVNAIHLDAAAPRVMYVSLRSGPVHVLRFASDALGQKDKPPGYACDVICSLSPSLYLSSSPASSPAPVLLSFQGYFVYIQGDRVLLYNASSIASDVCPELLSSFSFAETMEEEEQKRTVFWKDMKVRAAVAATGSPRYRVTAEKPLLAILTTSSHSTTPSADRDALFLMHSLLPNNSLQSELFFPWRLLLMFFTGLSVFIWQYRKRRRENQGTGADGGDKLEELERLLTATSHRSLGLREMAEESSRRLGEGTLRSERGEFGRKKTKSWEEEELHELRRKLQRMRDGHEEVATNAPLSPGTFEENDEADEGETMDREQKKKS